MRRYRARVFRERARSYWNRGKRIYSDLARAPVGASLLAMVVNDDAGNLMPRGALMFLATMLATKVFAEKH
jgi:hypothetical protein